MARIIQDDQYITYLLEAGETFLEDKATQINQQTATGLLACRKIKYNGRDKLYYKVAGYTAAVWAAAEWTQEETVRYLKHLAAMLTALKRQQCLKLRELDLQPEHMFVDTRSQSIRLVALPVAPGLSGTAASGREDRINSPKMEGIYDPRQGSVFEPNQENVFEAQQAEASGSRQAEAYAMRQAEAYAMRQAEASRQVQLEDAISEEKLKEVFYRILDLSKYSGERKLQMFREEIRKSTRFPEDLTGTSSGWQKATVKNYGTGKRYGEELVMEPRQGDTTILGMGEDPQWDIQEDPQPDIRSICLRAESGVRKLNILIDKDEFYIGKQASAVDGVANISNAISRRHCKIVKKKDGYYIEDLYSSNHTYVNGQMLIGSEQMKIREGDTVRLADVLFMVCDAERSG